MKISLALTLVCLFSFSALSQEAKPIDFRVKRVGYNSSYSSVIKQLGKPSQEKTTRYSVSESCTGEAATFRELKYPGMEIGLMGDGRGRGRGRGRGLKVYSILITSAKWNVSGVSVGASEADLESKLGKPSMRADLDYEILSEYDMKIGYGTVSFHFRNKKLFKILMEEAIC